MTSVREVVAVLEQLAPIELAESWDNVGLLIGSFDAEVKRILFTLDVTNEVVKEAVDKQIDLIIAHHPVIFHGQKTLVTHHYNQNIYINLIQNHISVYAAHTNLDNAPQGMNYWLAEALGLEQIEIMEEVGVTAEGVPYGTGCVGQFQSAMPLSDFVDYVAKQVSTAGIRYAGDKEQLIKKVALCGGAGASYYPSAIAKQADVYVTGDVKYHEAQGMLEKDLAVVDAGHYIEVICTKKLCDLYQAWITEENKAIECFISEINTDPFRFRK